MNIDKISDVITSSGLVISPTDTIYGIMGDALNEDVVRKIFLVKKRDFSKPLIVLMDSIEMVLNYTLELSEKELFLLNNISGVTILLKKNNKISDLITAGSDYVGIRIPDNKDLIKIIKKVGRPIVSTSANISDECVITDVSLLEPELIKDIDYIYDGGEIYSEASSVISLKNDKLVIIREGKKIDIIKKLFN